MRGILPFLGLSALVMVSTMAQGDDLDMMPAYHGCLLSSFENFLRNEASKEAALRRGGGLRRNSLDHRDDDGHLIHEISDDGSPEAEFHRQWALAVLDQVLAALANDYEREGKRTLFDALRPFLAYGSEQKPYSEVAEDLEMTVAAVKTSVHRLRRRYRRRLEAVVAPTVQDPQQIEAEIHDLFAAVVPHG